MKCSRLVCDRKAFVSGLCKTHWKNTINAGINGLTDSAAARDHVRKLQELNWSHDGIATAAGISRCSVRNILQRDQVRRPTERLVLALPLVPYASTMVRIPSVGLRRRYEALSLLGWPMSTTTAMAGSSCGAFMNNLKRGDCSVVYRDRYHAVYEQLNNSPGPSEVCARKAVKLGFVPAFAWDYVDIDDPKSRPFQGFRSEAA